MNTIYNTLRMNCHNGSRYYNHNNNMYYVTMHRHHKERQRLYIPIVKYISSYSSTTRWPPPTHHTIVTQLIFGWLLLLAFQVTPHSPPIHVRLGRFSDFFFPPEIHFCHLSNRLVSCIIYPSCYQSRSHRPVANFFLAKYFCFRRIYLFFFNLPTVTNRIVKICYHLPYLWTRDVRARPLVTIL